MSVDLWLLKWRNGRSGDVEVAQAQGNVARSRESGRRGKFGDIDVVSEAHLQGVEGEIFIPEP